MEPTKAAGDLGGAASGPSASEDPGSDPSASEPSASDAPDAYASDVSASGWSPLHAHGARLSWGLLAIFSAFYFVVAILTSAEFADLAATTVLGLPLGFILGMILIIAGLVITRVYLAKGEG